jgi:hypothetical protein
VLVGVALTVGAAPVRAAEPASAEALSQADTLVARAGLELDTSQAGATGPVIVSRLEELGNLELRRAEILPSRLGDDPVIRIRVVQTGDAAGEGETFTIRSEVAVLGEPLAGSAREVACPLCTEGEVVERARAEIVRLVPFVRARFKPAEPPPPRPTEPPPRPAEPPQDRGLSTGGKAGIGLLAGGTLAAATGLGLTLARARPDPDMPLNVLDTRPSGIAVLSVGAAALVAGAVLLGLDRRNARRSVRLAPLGAPASAGLMVLGRF